MNRIRTILLLVGATLIACTGAAADPFIDGVAALDRNELVVARRHLTKAAAQGHTEAQFQLASLLLRGAGGPRSTKRAAYWFRQAAQRNHAEAQYELGAILFDGLAGEPKPNAAAAWFKKAANLRHAKAAFRLGALYDNGVGVPKNEKRAFQLYKQAARGGVLEAEHLVGILLITGTRGEQDLIEGGVWLRLALKGGDVHVAGDWARLAEALTAAQRAEIERRLNNHIDSGFAVGSDHVHP